MKTEKYEIKEEIASVCFTKKELLVFRKKTRDGTPFCEINKSKLQWVIYKTAKKNIKKCFHFNYWHSVSSDSIYNISPF